MNRMKDFTKSMGAKISEQEYTEYSSLATQLGFNNSELVRNALSEYCAMHKTDGPHDKEINSSQSNPAKSLSESKSTNPNKFKSEWNPHNSAQVQNNLAIPIVLLTVGLLFLVFSEK